MLDAEMPPRLLPKSIFPPRINAPVRRVGRWGPDEAVDTHRPLFKPAPVAMGVNVQTRMAAVILQSADQGGLTGSGLDDQPCLPFVLGRIALRKEDILSLRALCSNG